MGDYRSRVELMRRILFALLALLYGCLPAVEARATAVTIGAVYPSNQIATPVNLGAANGNTSSVVITTTADSPAGNFLWVWVYVFSGSIPGCSITTSAGDTLS